MGIDPISLGLTVAGSLLGSSSSGGADPYSSALANQAKYWNKQGKAPITKYGQYLTGLFNNPYGEEFQTAWKNTQENLQRQYEPLIANLQFNLAKRMGTSNSSTMPGLTSYAYGKWGQDAGDWLRNYAMTAKERYGNLLSDLYRGMIGQTQSGMSQAASSWQAAQNAQNNNLQSLGNALGQLYAYGKKPTV
jgi:hypothetical protein